jgi:YcxB-like protein
MIPSTDRDIRINFTLTLPELHRANRTIIASRLRTPPLLSVIVLLLLLGVAVPAVVNWGGEDQVRDATQNAWIVLIVLVFLFLYASYALPYTAARSSFKNNVAMRNPIHYSFSDGGVKTESATGCSDRLWIGVARVRETREFFLLYLSNTMAFPIPKRAFNGEHEIQEFRALVQRNVRVTKLRA